MRNRGILGNARGASPRVNAAAAAVRAVRRARGLTQRELADRAGVTRTALIRLERGGRVSGSTRTAVITRGLGFALPADLIAAASPGKSG